MRRVIGTEVCESIALRTRCSHRTIICAASRRARTRYQDNRSLRSAFPSLRSNRPSRNNHHAAIRAAPKRSSGGGECGRVRPVRGQMDVPDGRICHGQQLPPSTGRSSTRPRNIKKPRVAGLSQCAREDSNLHGSCLPQGPQPCASTNSATGARARQYRPGSDGRCRARGRAGGCAVAILSPSVGGATVPNRCSTCRTHEANEQGADRWT
jgi:hypothetical protein